MTFKRTIPLLLSACIAIAGLWPPSLSADPSISDRAWTTLQAGLTDKSTDKRAEAVSALGVMAHNKKAAGMAENALDDSSPNVRAAAVLALGDMDSKASLPRIKSFIDHTDAKTLMAIAAVLKKVNDPEAYEIYYEVLTGKRKGGGSILDGLKDKKALEKMGAEAVIGILPFGGLGTGAYNYIKQNGSSQANAYLTAVNALADDKDPLAEKALVQASFGGKEAVQVAALRALAKRGNPAIVPDIQPAIDSEKSAISYTAAAVILHLLDLRSSNGKNAVSVLHR